MWIPCFSAHASNMIFLVTSQWHAQSEFSGLNENICLTFSQHLLEAVFVHDVKGVMGLRLVFRRQFGDKGARLERLVTWPMMLCYLILIHAIVFG